MKLKFAILSAIVLVFASCSNPSGETSANDSTKATTVPEKTNSSDCYRYVNNNDTVIMKINENNSTVSGTLMYNLFEKDKNTGTIQGEMKGDLLIAQYTFMSEGMESVRAVAFRKMGKNFLEGHGESVVVDGKDVFVNTDSLDFTNSILLSPYDCK